MRPEQKAGMCLDWSPLSGRNFCPETYIVSSSPTECRCGENRGKNPAKVLRKWGSGAVPEPRGDTTAAGSRVPGRCCEPGSRGQSLQVWASGEEPGL